MVPSSHPVRIPLLSLLSPRKVSSDKQTSNNSGSSGPVSHQIRHGGPTNEHLRHLRFHGCTREPARHPRFPWNSRADCHRSVAFLRSRARRRRRRAQGEVPLPQGRGARHPGLAAADRAAGHLAGRPLRHRHPRRHLHACVAGPEGHPGASDPSRLEGRLPRPGGRLGLRRLHAEGRHLPRPHHLRRPHLGHRQRHHHPLGAGLRGHVLGHRPQHVGLERPEA